MDKAQFIRYLDEHPDTYDWEYGEHGGKAGIFVKNNEYDTMTHFTLEVIEKYERDALLTWTHHGRNVENITRVTGFFSKTNAWNKGKTAELKDRKRDTLG